jgi:membrane fusion protein (multidrug efflux system)
MRPILPALLLFALSSCGGGDGDKQRQLPLVTAEVVRSVPFVDRIEAVGTARAKEQVTLSAPVTERIVRIHFEDGGYVRAGQVVAELAQGQETAELADAHARAREATQQLRRLEALKASGFATNSSVDAQIAQAASARAQAAQANASIGDRVVRAPFGGWASLRTISAGAVVTAGTPIATISDVSEIKLDFPVPETLLSSLAIGQTIEAQPAAFPGQIFRGTIATIDPVIDPATRSVMVRAILPNPGNRLKPGMLLTVVIESAPRTAPAVPELAVVGQAEQRFVFVVGPGDKVKRVLVKTGVRDRGLIEIVEGLKPGQKVVSEGVVKVSDGIQVRLAGATDTKPPERRRP